MIVPLHTVMNNQIRETTNPIPPLHTHAEYTRCHNRTPFLGNQEKNEISHKKFQFLQIFGIFTFFGFSLIF